MEPKKPQVIHSDQLSDKTGQTRNLPRFAAITPEKMNMTGPGKLFFGRGTAPPHTRSAPHHHGEAETGCYILKGRARIYFGEGFKESVEYGPGDYAYVPANVPHIEANDWDEELDTIFARSPDNLVYNLEDAKVEEEIRLH